MPPEMKMSAAENIENYLISHNQKVDWHCASYLEHLVLWSGQVTHFR